MEEGVCKYEGYTWLKEGRNEGNCMNVINGRNFRAHKRSSK
jgi:hypothetical protein